MQAMAPLESSIPNTLHSRQPGSRCNENGAAPLPLGEVFFPLPFGSGNLLAEPYRAARTPPHRRSFIFHVRFAEVRTWVGEMKILARFRTAALLVLIGSALQPVMAASPASEWPEWERFMTRF